MPCITKESMKNATRRRQRVEMPECGQDAYVFVREMTAKQYTQLRKFVSTLNTPNPDEVLDSDYALLADCLVDDDGNKLFDSMEEVKANADFGLDTLKRLAIAIVTMSVGKDEEPKN